MSDQNGKTIDWNNGRKVVLPPGSSVMVEYTPAATEQSPNPETHRLFVIAPHGRIESHGVQASHPDPYVVTAVTDLDMIRRITTAKGDKYEETMQLKSGDKLGRSNVGMEDCEIEIESCSDDITIFEK